MTDEYIRKEDAIRVAAYYQIKRNGFPMSDYEYGRNQVADSVASDLEDMSPVDVVQVVRCKDCKYRESDDFCVGRGFPYQLVAGDEFCSRAKTKEHIND